MKSALPFYGMPVPAVRKVARSAIRGESSADVLLRLARDLWDHATHREHWYAAMTVLAARPLRGDQSLVPVIEHLVRTGQWWDVTDDLASRVRELLDAHRTETSALLRDWAVDSDIWMRRIAIIAQLGRRDLLDRELLAAVIEPNREDREFFIRKGIGWALRDAARTYPEWVSDYVSTHQLSPLSHREATKHLRAALSQPR